MAESAVTFLLDKLAPFLDKEMNLLSGGREEVAFIRAELERIRAFLKKADALEETDDEVKVWVRQIREISHEIEDVLDESLLLLAHSHCNGLYGLIHRFSCCVKNMKARYRIASEIRGISAKIKSVCDGHRRFRQKFRSDEQGSAGTKGTLLWQDNAGDAFLLDGVDLVGIDEPKRRIVGWLVDGGLGRKVIAITGMGGLGKTTLAKQVYDDAEVKKHFAVRACVRVTRPFKIESLLKDLVKQLFKVIRRPVPKGVNKMTSFQLKKLIKVELLSKERYLVVLDDTGDIEGWDAMKHALPSEYCGSRVLITTRNMDLAVSACVETQGEVYNLSPLPVEESWTLFCKKTFQGNPCPSHLEEICRQILRKCEGLPLAIVAISGALATKDRLRMDEWEMVRRSLGAEIDSNDKLKNLKKVLSLSFNDLPYYLKSCFLFFSVFPEHRLVEHVRLIRLWTAEGFIEAKEGKTQEEVAEEYFNELLNRSLIQVVTTRSDGRVEFCRIHDLLREIIILKSKEQNFAAVAKEPNTSIWADKVRRLSIQNSLRNIPPNRSVSLPLRSLFTFGITEKPSLHRLFPEGFKLLTVLDMTAAPITKFPVEALNLYYLKYLSLRKTEVKTIPRFIGKLQSLETFDLKHSYVTELPVEIVKLKRLRHLLVYRYEFESYAHFNSRIGFRALDNIGELQALQKLCLIEVNRGNTKVVLSELRKLTQLRRLGVMKLRQEDGEILCSSIEKLTNLQAMSIFSAEQHEVINLKHLYSPPPLLQRLYLTGRLESMPHWIPYLHSLVKVFLKWSRLTEDPLVHLQDLPNLVHLELLQVYEGDTLHFKKDGFKKLKILGLDKFELLKYIQIEQGAMLRAEVLSIQRCKCLQKVPLGIEHLKNLKKLEFFDMPHGLIKTLRVDENGGDDYWRIAHIPEVYSAYWRDGKWEVYSLESFRQEDCAPQAADMFLSSEELHSRWK